MTTATARRWFAPSHEFHSSLDDYAVVGATSTQIRHGKAYADNGCNRRGLHQPTFADMLLELRLKRCYLFAMEGRLVYADVDNQNPKHKEDVYNRMAKEALLDAESDSVKSARKKLIEHFATEWYGHEKAIQGDTDADRCKLARNALKNMVLEGTIDDAVIGYILSAETGATKTELLNIMSCQTRLRTPRPVLVVIDMIDDMQSTEMGVTKGWVIGYEFVKDLLIIKPFVSTPDQHPLGGSWYAPVENDDGINYSGCPGTFATNYVLAVQNHQDTKTAVPPSFASGSLPAAFKSFVHTVAAKWILRSWKPLSSSPSMVNKFPSAETLKTAISTHSIMLSMTRFPIQQKANACPSPSRSLSSLSISSTTASGTDTVTGIATEEGEDATEKRAWRFDTFMEIQDLLESEETDIRAVALRAKRAGDVDLAERAAAVFEDVLSLVREINKGAEGDGCWEGY